MRSKSRTHLQPLETCYTRSRRSNHASPVRLRTPVSIATTQSTQNEVSFGVSRRMLYIQGRPIRCQVDRRPTQFGVYHSVKIATPPLHCTPREKLVPRPSPRNETLLSMDGRQAARWAHSGTPPLQVFTLMTLHVIPGLAL